MNRGSIKRGEFPCGVAFLLSQLGAHSAGLFGQRLASLGLMPPHAGLLRKIASDPGINQQALAEHLGVLPSRMVALLDELEAKKLIERATIPEDRRTYALRLTARGQQVLYKIAEIAVEFEQDLCAALSRKEQATLVDLCSRIVKQQGLTPGVHPGYRQLGRIP